MKMTYAIAAMLAVGSVTAANAATTVVTFDDLPGGQSSLDIIPDGYGGITWASNWTYYGFDNDPYNPQTAPNKAIVNYALHPAGVEEAVPFYFAAPVVFQGAFFAGYAGQFGLKPVTFQLYNAGTLVATSATITVDGTPTWLASGYSGLVDEVRIDSSNGYYVFDNVTYGAVPEPESWALMIAGFGMVGFAMRRRVAVTA